MTVTPPPPATAPVLPSLPPSLAQGPPSAGVAGKVAGRLLRNTPRRMSAVLAVCVVAQLVLGVVSAWALSDVRASARGGATNAEQVQRMDTVIADWQKADASVTMLLLEPGTPSPQLQSDYDSAIGRVARSVAAAAGAQSTDGPAMEQVSASLQEYVRRVEQAKADNRAGNPVGYQYLTEAKEQQVYGMSVVDAVRSENVKRTDSRFSGTTRTAVLLVLALLGLGWLVFASFWLARRTHRYINLQFLLGCVLIACCVLGALAASVTAAGQLHSVQVKQHRQAGLVSQARANSFQARAIEARMVNQRGVGVAAAEADWQKLKVRGLLKDAGQADLAEDKAWAQYLGDHKEITQKVTTDWPAAKAKVRENSGKLTQFDDATARRASGLADESKSKLGAVGRMNNLFAMLVALAAIVSIVLSIRGFGDRIREYTS